jgi:AbrB family looped-hinge helix DNA binding protein
VTLGAFAFVLGVPDSWRREDGTAPSSVEFRSRRGTAVRFLLQINNPTYDMLTDFTSHVILKPMSTTEKPETVWFTTKGQVVIPLRLRKQFDIEDGTKAVVQATPEGILLKPMTAALIKRGRGILKRAPGGKPLAEGWAEHKKQERALEGRHAG